MAATPAARAFRRLLRAQRLAFEGDIEMLQRANYETRKAFLENSHERDAEKLAAMLKEADEAVTFISTQIVQAVKSDDGNYSSFVQRCESTRGTQHPRQSQGAADTRVGLLVHVLGTTFLYVDSGPILATPEECRI
eukprot:EC119452.1.p2 GENE.EC119452.1~~EC119452.1.p2  ORF type:complete len:136 (+),score=14.77 EC119452.1:119-526(+)